MASIDFTTLGLGALIGIGCQRQLKAAGRVVASATASLATAAAQAASQVAEETQETETSSGTQAAAGQSGKKGG